MDVVSKVLPKSKTRRVFYWYLSDGNCVLSGGTIANLRFLCPYQPVRYMQSRSSRITITFDASQYCVWRGHICNFAAFRPRQQIHSTVIIK